MADKPQIGFAEDVGTTTLYAGSVGTTAILIPGVASGNLTSILVRCPTQTPQSKKILFSLDNITYHALDTGASFGWDLMGGVQQVYIKGSTSGVLYEVVVNKEPS